MSSMNHIDKLIQSFKSDRSSDERFNSNIRENMKEGKGKGQAISEALKVFIDTYTELLHMLKGEASPGQIKLLTKAMSEDLSRKISEFPSGSDQRVMIGVLHEYGLKAFKEGDSLKQELIQEISKGLTSRPALAFGGGRPRGGSPSESPSPEAK